MIVAEIIDYFSPLPLDSWQNVNALGQL